MFENLDGRTDVGRRNDGHLSHSCTTLCQRFIREMAEWSLFSYCSKQVWHQIKHVYVGCFIGRKNETNKHLEQPFICSQ